MNRERLSYYDLGSNYNERIEGRRQNASRSSPISEVRNKNKKYSSHEPDRLKIKNLLQVLLELDDRAIGCQYLNQAQKTTVNDTLSSVQNLIRSLSIQYSNSDMPSDVCNKLYSMVECIESLVYSVTSKGENVQYGIFQDRISNLSPSISSRSLNGNYEDGLVSSQNQFKAPYYAGHSNGDNEDASFGDAYDDEDSEFDDEELSDHSSIERNFQPSYRKPMSTQSELRPHTGSYFDGPRIGRTAMSAFVTPTKGTLQNHRRDHLQGGRLPIRSNSSINDAKYSSIKPNQTFKQNRHSPSISLHNFSADVASSQRGAPFDAQGNRSSQFPRRLQKDQTTRPIFP